MEGFMAWSHSAHFVSLDRPNHGQDSKGGLGKNMYFTLEMGGHHRTTSYFNKKCDLAEFSVIELTTTV